MPCSWDKPAAQMQASFNTMVAAMNPLMFAMYNPHIYNPLLRQQQQQQQQHQQHKHEEWTDEEWNWWVQQQQQCFHQPLLCVLLWLLAASPS